MLHVYYNIFTISHNSASQWFFFAAISFSDIVFIEIFAPMPEQYIYLPGHFRGDSFSRFFSFRQNHLVIQYGASFENEKYSEVFKKLVYLCCLGREK